MNEGMAKRRLTKKGATVVQPRPVDSLGQSRWAMCAAPATLGNRHGHRYRARLDRRLGRYHGLRPRAPHRLRLLT